MTDVKHQSHPAEVRHRTERNRALATAHNATLGLQPDYRGPIPVTYAGEQRRPRGPRWLRRDRRTLAPVATSSGAHPISRAFRQRQR